VPVRYVEGIVLLPSVSVWNVRGFIVLQYVSVRYLQCHRTAVSFSAVGIGALLYCSLCQWFMYGIVILQQSVSVPYLQGHYCTAVFYCGTDRGIILLQFVSITDIQGNYFTAIYALRCVQSHYCTAV
jgi:hypothetical protein